MPEIKAEVSLDLTMTQQNFCGIILQQRGVGVVTTIPPPASQDCHKGRQTPDILSVSEYCRHGGTQTACYICRLTRQPLSERQGEHDTMFCQHAVTNPSVRTGPNLTPHCTQTTWVKSAHWHPLLSQNVPSRVGSNCKGSAWEGAQ